MSELSPALLGVIFVFLGLGFMAATQAAIRNSQRKPVLLAAKRIQSGFDPSTSHDDGLLFVQAGGRIRYINHAAQRLFDDWDELPDLENLARRARPGEDFLALCSYECKAYFLLNGRTIEGASYFVPCFSDGDPRPMEGIAVVLRPTQLVFNRSAGLINSSANEAEPAALQSAQAFQIFTEISQAIANSTNVNSTIRTILESAERIIPSDFLEATVLIGEPKELTRFRFVGLPGDELRLERAEGNDPSESRLSDYLIKNRKPLLIRDIDRFEDLHQKADGITFPYRSYIGVPLTTCGEIIGSFEVASLSPGFYSDNDLELMNLLAGQAAISLKNALAFEKEHRLTCELSGLVQLAQVVHLISDPRDLYHRLVESIATIFPVEFLGFLIYDEERRLLRGQTPFFGILDSVVEWYQTTIEPGSLKEEVINRIQPILSEDATEDARLQLLEFQHLAQASGIRQVVLIPLSSGGRSLGFLVVAKKRDGTGLGSADMRLLEIIASQASPIIENAGLVQGSRQRAQRAESLRRIASLTSSAATLDEILKYSLQDLARLLGADAAVISLIDENHGELSLHEESAFGFKACAGASIAQISINSAEYQQSAVYTQKAFVVENLLGKFDSRLNYWPWIKEFRLQSIVCAPLICRERGIGELLVGSFKPDFFLRLDLQTVVTAAGLLAAAIDQSALSLQTDQTLRLRIEQLTSITRISRELNRTLDLQRLLQQVFDELIKMTGADCGSIFLFQIDTDAFGFLSERIEPVLQQAEIIHYVGDRPGETLGELEAQVILTGESQIIRDFNEIQMDHGPRPVHAGIRSVLMIPISYQGQIAGLVQLHAWEADRFGSAEREIGEALAVQASFALGNAMRYADQIRRAESLKTQVEVLTGLLDVSRALGTERPIENMLEMIAGVILTATPFNAVAISLLDHAASCLVRVAFAGIPDQAIENLCAYLKIWADFEAFLKPDLKIGAAYFFPSEEAILIQQDINQPFPLADENDTGEGKTWKLNDLLVVPIFSSSGEPLGLISLGSPRDRRRPDRSTIETLEIISRQTSGLIEGHQKNLEMNSQIKQIGDEIESTRQLANETWHDISDLTERSHVWNLKTQDLESRAARFRGCLDLVNLISLQTSREKLFSTLGDEIVKRMDFDAVLIASKSQNSLNLIEVFGQIPPETYPQLLLGQKNPFRACMNHSESLFISDVDESEEWRETPLLHSLQARSFICFTLPDDLYEDARFLEGNASCGQIGLLATSQKARSSFTKDDKDVMDLLAIQTAASLRNIGYYELTARRLREVNLLLDFSQKLGNLDLASIIQSLLESTMKLVPGAQMAMVALWDSRMGCLIPHSAAGYSDMEELKKVLYRPGESLAGIAFDKKQTIKLDEIDFLVHYNFRSENMIHFRKATGGKLPVSSIAVPIMTGMHYTEIGGEAASAQKDRSNETGQMPIGVLVLDNSENPGSFHEEDLAVLTSLAHQTALSIENARLFEESEQRSRQLQALTRASTRITSILEKEPLIASLLDQIKYILNYDTGTLWLRNQDRNVDRLVIVAARGFDPKDQQIGLTVDIQDSRLMDEMIRTRKPLRVPNVLDDPRFHPITLEEESGFENDGGLKRIGIENKCLSWLGIPLVLSDQVSGVIALEKAESDYFSLDDIQVAATFAAQAASSLKNADLYQDSISRALELDQYSQTLNNLYRLSGELSKSLNAEEILTTAAQEFLELLSCSSVSVFQFFEPGEKLEMTNFLASEITLAKDRIDFSLKEQRGSFVLQVELPATAPGISQIPVMTFLPETPIVEHITRSGGIFTTTDVSDESDLEVFKELFSCHNTCSLLIVPILSGSIESTEGDAFREIHGLIFAHTIDFHHFSYEEVELARTICNQVATALKKARLFEETRSLTEGLELRVQQRTADLEREHMRSETLLRIMTELSASLDLNQVLDQTLLVLSEYVDADQISILIQRPDQTKLQRLALIRRNYELEQKEQDHGQLLEQDLGAWILRHRQPLLLKHASQDNRWQQHFLTEDKNRFESVIAVPLMSGAEALGCLVLFNSKPDYFSLDQLDLVQAAANQVSISVNNAELFRLIRDQAEDLGSMLRNQQIETSRSKAILEAVADGVLVTDSNRQITLFNESAEKILGIDRLQAIGKSMEHFAGLFGLATSKWLEKINGWSSVDEGRLPGHSQIEQIILEDGRVISVHLAPVSLRNDFLGTVSIFQDVTHQVEVDRLKSEFVATVSHELRTPMTSIKGYVEILLMGAAGDLSEQQIHFLNVVKKNTERLSVLVNDLLDISQIESGRVRLSLVPLNLEQIAENALEDFQLRIKDGERIVHVDNAFEPHLPLVQADPDKIRRVFDNLLENAYLYNLEDGHIRLSIKRSGMELQVNVEDSGIGINPIDKTLVFERFYRGENSLTLGVAGTGLGLSIVKSMIEMHGGRIWVESSGIPGQGCIFSFALPVYLPEL